MARDAISYRHSMTVRGRLMRGALRRRTVARRRAAWLIAVGAPALLALGLWPVRASFGLAGFLLWALLVVVVVAVAGGFRPALLATALGAVAAAYFTPPYGTLTVDLHPNLVALVAFLAVAVITSLLVDELARIAQEQAVLRHVATLAAGPSSSGELFGSVVEAIGDLFAVDLVLLIRYRPDATALVVGSWRRTDEPVPVGTRSPLGGENLTSRIAETGRPARMSGYRDDGSAITRTALSVGTRASAGAPILVEHSLWGSIIVQSEVGRRLPRDLESRLSQFTELVALAIASADARSELTASRARIVAAADATRRQIERDLHDGAQQRLVSLGLELRATEAALPVGLDDVGAQIAATVRGLQDVVEGIQEISRGIHPAIVSRGGLGPAVRALARRSPVPVDLDLAGDRRLSEPVEVAAYYVVSEALTNVAKHADASVVSVTLTYDASKLRLTVADDGLGGADPGAGSGLVGLFDRIEVLGGTLDVVSPPGVGTTLTVELPIPPPAPPESGTTLGAR